MRVGICQQLGIAYYAQFTEPQAAALLKIDASTLKRWRNAGKVFPVVLPGGKYIRYFGYQIADIAMGRPVPWDESANISSDNIGSENETSPPIGTAAGLKGGQSSASRLAQTILKPRNKS